jgi:hypothetical protein
MRTGRLLVGLAALASVFLMPPRTAMGSAVLTVELESAAKPGLEFKHFHHGIAAERGHGAGVRGRP